ncbi:MAG: 50S ribosomal protein L4 [Patescibacteria group bacterium]|nr:50S ribosomal protein L4 [Patescibacteria group bacterium]
MSIQVKLYNQKIDEIGKQELNPVIFGVKAKSELIKQAVVAQQANSRQVLAHAKDRSEVRGGGKKPWRQKGTGRARAGSSRSPIWIGGGVTFGPTKERNFSVKINKKMKKKALFMCLSNKAENEKMILFDKIELEKIQTKKIVEMLSRVDAKIINSKIEKSDKKKNRSKKKKNSILLILNDKSENIIKSARNIPNVKTIKSDCLNVVEVLKYKYLLTTVEAVKEIEEAYLPDRINKENIIKIQNSKL